MSAESWQFSPASGVPALVKPPLAKRYSPAVMQGARPAPELLIAHDPYHPRCEKLRALRTELLLRRTAASGAEVMALLSPGACEGRSHLAAELAISFAQLGQPTLLVDADLRNPRQHALFGTSNHTGLTDAIARREEPSLQPVEGLRHLSLVTAGPRGQTPLELLLNDYFAALIEDWRSRFAFVIIDTAPIGAYSDGLAVASLARRVLAVSRARHTRSGDGRDMLRRLATTRSEIVGAVINHF